MTKSEFPMNDQIQMTKLCHHWSLAIGISLVIGVWSLVISPRCGAQEIRLRRTAPPPADAAHAPAVGPPTAVRGDEITPQQKAAVEKGLIWLANHQGHEGSYGGEGLGRHAGITGLAGLAFMEAGNLPNRGKYGENVSKCLDFVLSASQESGLISADNSQGPMYGHGFATLFLGEIYGMTGDDRVKEKLQKAVRLIEHTQNNEGGWRYMPVPYDADISVTICQVMALRAARDAGIKVEKDVVDKAIKYVISCQNPDGGFSYQSPRSGGGSQSGFARSAAGVSALYYAGVFDGDNIVRGLKYLVPFNPSQGGQDIQMEGHYYYGNYYAVQAMFLAGGDYWAKWYPSIRDQLINKQDNDGSWQGDASKDYATAMALIILQMPNRYLPVFTGKGPGS
ncbi:MAG TPA: prenyltransferase/squalene oxidase repeat-containing protein [Tepidisphaeraceae bacterium]|jgi:prenyltransferase beta subunit|nr:prenyltransferase/squalene oxidase repeat-containing protein [Tepidisphaeraceae bacterium]